MEHTTASSSAELPPTPLPTSQVLPTPLPQPTPLPTSQVLQTPLPTSQALAPATSVFPTTPGTEVYRNLDHDLCPSCAQMHTYIEHLYHYWHILGQDSAGIVIGTVQSLTYGYYTNCPSCIFFVSIKSRLRMTSQPKVLVAFMIRSIMPFLTPFETLKLMSNGRLLIAFHEQDIPAGHTCQLTELPEVYCYLINDRSQLNDSQRLRFRSTQQANLRVSSFIDFKEIIAWFESHTLLSCRRPFMPPKYHAYVKAHILTRTPLYAIDCINRTIVPISWDDQFIALSYVWGKEEQNQSEVNESEGLLRDLPRQCPQTIEDAMIVVRKLERRYLWVDRYCIDQRNAALKHDQIASMDIIYEKALFTNIAAEGDSAEAGLHGISKSLAFPSLRLVVGNIIYSVSEPCHHQMPLETTWNKRAWTYQEYIFSNHSALFTSESLTLICLEVIKFMEQKFIFSQSQSFSESPHILSDPYSEEYQLLSRMTQHLQLFEHSPKAVEYSSEGSFVIGTKPIQSVFQIFEEHVMNYTRRKMTYDSDSLNAIQAVLESFKRNISGLDFCFGLPITSIYGVLPEQRGLLPTVSFAHSLNWTHGTRLDVISSRRRPEFPSWSWTGWEGDVVGWLHHFDPDWEPDSYTSFQYLNWKGETQLMDELAGRCHIDTHPRKILVTAKCVLVKFKYQLHTENLEGLESSYAYYLDGGEANNSVACLHPTRRASNSQDWHSRLLGESWNAFPLGSHSANQSQQTMLVVGSINPEDQHYERIGIFLNPGLTFSHSSLDRFWMA
jgi:Heterokaryon incompatibility protein (HET)